MLAAQGLLLGAALAFLRSLMRTRVYVDGLNLYYRAVRGTKFKWLNPVKLSVATLPQTCVVDKLLYFTARVSGSFDPDAPKRQKMYLDALSTLPEVEIHFGRFLAADVWAPVINLPVANRLIGAPQPVTLPVGHHPVAASPPHTSSQTLYVGNYQGGPRRRIRPDAVVAKFRRMEEKGSDVNLGAHLLNDAWAERFDAAAVISNDTDLVTPIRMVTDERKKPVFVVCPGGGPMAAELSAVATYKRHIRHSMLRDAQFPATLPGTTISKPTGW